MHSEIYAATHRRSFTYLVYMATGDMLLHTGFSVYRLLPNFNLSIDMHAETCAYRNLRGNTQNITHLSSLRCDWQHILYTGFFVCIRTFAKFHFEYWYAYGNLCILKPKAQRRSLTYLVYVATVSRILYTEFSVCIQTFTKFYFEYWYAYMLYAYKNLCVNTHTDNHSLFSLRDDTYYTPDFLYA